MSIEPPFFLTSRAVILDADGRCLLLRRSAASRNFAGLWEWPGGKPDPGEDFSAALRREVREETGLEVAFTGLAGASEFEMTGRRIIMLCLLAKPTGGELKISAEHDQFVWQPLSELSGWEIIEPMKPILKTLLATR